MTDLETLDITAEMQTALQDSVTDDLSYLSSQLSSISSNPNGELTQTQLERVVDELVDWQDALSEGLSQEQLNKLDNTINGGFFSIDTQESLTGVIENLANAAKNFDSGKNFLGEDVGKEVGNKSLSEYALNQISLLSEKLSQFRGLVEVPSQKLPSEPLKLDSPEQAVAMNALNSAFTRVTSTIDPKVPAQTPTLDKEITIDPGLVRSFGKTLQNLDNTIRNTRNQDNLNLPSKEIAQEMLQNLHLERAQLKAFGEMLKVLENQLPQNGFEYVFGNKGFPSKALMGIIHNFAETIRQAQPDLEQQSPSVAATLPIGQGIMPTVDLHTKITEGLPTRYDTTELTNNLFKAGATLSAFEKAMSDKGLDLETLSSRLEALQEKVLSNKDIYPELNKSLETIVDKIESSSQLSRIISGHTKELNDYFLLGRKGVEGAQGLGRLQGEDSHKALVVLAQRLNEENILDKLVMSQNRDTALQMEDFGKYEDLCNDLCKLGFGAPGGGGLFGHAIDRGKVEGLIAELQPFTGIADKIAEYQPVTYSQDEERLLNTLRTAGISGESQLNALQQNIQEYAAYKAKIASLPQELEDSITALRAKRDAAIEGFSQDLADEAKRTFLEKVAQSGMIQQEITPDKTKPQYDIFTVSGDEVKLKGEASERLKEAFDKFEELGHLTVNGQGTYLWGTNAFLPRLDGEQPLQAAVGDTVATNNAKFITALGEVLPVIPDSTVNLKDYYKTLEEHVKASKSQQVYESANDLAHKNHFDSVTKLLKDGFIGQLSQELTKETNDPNLMALIKLQRAAA